MNSKFLFQLAGAPGSNDDYIEWPVALADTISVEGRERCQLRFDLSSDPGQLMLQQAVKTTFVIPLK